MKDPKLFSAYMLDPEHGWHVVHELSLDAATLRCEEYRNDWAGSRVVVVPDGVDPNPYLESALA